MTNERLITPSEIAELTGFALPTVSNWMKRFDDFPEGRAVEGSKRLRYDRDEVLAWLKRRNLSRETTREHTALLSIDRDDRRDFLGTLFVVLHAIPNREKASVNAVMEKYRELASSSVEDLVNFDLTRVPDVVSDLVPRYKGLTDLDLVDTLSAIDDGLQGRFSGETSTPQILVEFLGALAPSTEGTVLDLASGQGRLLEHLATRGIGTKHMGREINRNAVIQARQSAKLRGLDVNYAVIDGLSPVEPGSCALVVVDPPLGLTSAPTDVEGQSWPFGRPSSRDLGTAFMQRAVEALEPGGTAMVLSLQNLVSRGGDIAELRRRLLAAGVIRAVVSLPARLRVNTAVPLALWILGPPGSSNDSVVMVDASLCSPSQLSADGPVVAAIRAELAQDDKNRNEAFATTVQVRELLTRDVALRPNAWVAKQRDLIEPQEQLALARAGLESVENLIGLLPVSSKELEIDQLEPVLITLSDLADRGSLKIVRSPLTRAAEDGTGAPVLDGRELRGDRNKESARRLADDSTPGLLIEPGDIVVAAGAKAVMAEVWQEEGWVAGSAVQVIRPRRSEIDAHFLAAAIQHPRNLAHVDPGALKIQLNIRGFEVPDLHVEDQRRLAALAGALNDAERELQSRLARLSQAKRAVLEAIGSGTLAVVPVKKS
jgi:predicted DNA-binding transcriptional regulator AlpA/methylase of polypeptide subunit release factors